MLSGSGYDDDNISTSSDNGNEDDSLSSNVLCPVCRHIDFEHVGFHDSSEYSSNYYCFRREFPFLLKSSKRCIFCKRIVSTITDWIAENPDDRTNELDVSRTHVDVSLETDWHSVSREKDGGGVDEKAHSDRIRINCAVPSLRADDKTGESQFLTFFFQRYENQPCQDGGIDYGRCLSANHEVQPYSGSKRPLLADMTLFRRWKQLCQDKHGAKCSQIFKGSPNIRPRVIDVNRRCLAFADENEQWVCLSYVWGKANTLTLTKDKVEEFLLPGALDRGILPNIIEDALQVTTGLGERYLWVDSLCIIQDDEQDKAHFISQMDSIYTLATVVMIAATCVNANSCLPGVRPGSRTQEQEPFKIRDATLVQSLDPVLGVKIDLRTARAAGYLGESVWDTRAWTLQERFLDARSLVFTAEQVFWECEEAFWCEDSFREVAEIGPDPHRTSLCKGEQNLSWNDDILTFDHFYRVLLEEYSGRSLTYDSDGLNAFAGIVQALERSKPFFWGMPTAYLESALAWGHQNHKLRRRRGIQLLGDNQASLGKDQFPSWSWVGWTSDAQTKLANQNLTTEALGLRFYRVSEDGKSIAEMKQATSFNQKFDLLVEGSDLADRSSRPYEVSIEDLPAESPISLSSFLCFWTASAQVQITTLHAKDDSGFDINDPSLWEMTFSQGTDSTVQVSWSHTAPSLKQGDQVEVIAVGQNRGNWAAGNIEDGAIGVMIISWDTSGTIAFREGFAWIAIRNWTALRDRRWKLIVLG